MQVRSTLDKDSFAIYRDLYVAHGLRIGEALPNFVYLKNNEPQRELCQKRRLYLV